MYFSEFKKVVEENTEYPAQVRAIIDAADKYYISRYGQQANVSGSLPNVELRKFANVIFNMFGAGFVGRDAFIDDCITAYRQAENGDAVGGNDR